MLVIHPRRMQALAKSKSPVISQVLHGHARRVGRKLRVAVKDESHGCRRGRARSPRPIIARPLPQITVPPPPTIDAVIDRRASRARHWITVPPLRRCYHALRLSQQPGVYLANSSYAFIISDACLTTDGCFVDSYITSFPAAAFFHPAQLDCPR